ncbi:MAG: hypothetical protein JJ934_05815 [Pseudomonadales bacterium]|nr:hypothetical protein [Pseudomonadales bacterium]MBO6656387.1 hypothetical protein [Pseudomonadales bacterium]MBO6702693.1 hypothetical protein [Pseudomonadales bacterium]MBO7004693.1 hypothetical protein [Pseudomonadales bacterium]
MPQPQEPLIVDVEASGFGGDSYPIEIGLALQDGSKFCTLIAPAPDWTHWDDEAETVHRISRDILETYGKPMQDVANFLNDILAGKTVYTDGWVVDKPWLTRLFHAAGVEMDFTVSSLEMILSPDQMEVWHDTKDKVVEDMELKRHRASYDALIIQETYKRTLQS